jgi:hypothetical protein
MPEYKQTSFNGGMNLLLDDSRLSVSQNGELNQYRLGINLSTRFDVCSPVLASEVDSVAPLGNKQGIVTIGNYIVIFCSGSAYYRLNTDNGWWMISGFQMSSEAPRFWTAVIPLTTTNYGRYATAITGAEVTSSANSPIYQSGIVKSTFESIPGLLVQDGINQPRFIYVDYSGVIQCRITQTYDKWSFDPSGVDDKREYVPVGTFMEWYNGILFIVDSEYNYIYRSVSGRPLDFVVNVTKEGKSGGDATTTSYSVGIGGITAMKAIPGDILFVAAGGANNFAITLDKSNVAVKEFGEWTFNRAQLFNANCITERGVIDMLGDTVFIDATGLRSFNAIKQQQNQGRNSIFSTPVQSLFEDVYQSAPTNNANLKGWCAAINFDNYAIFSVNTTLGYALIVYDTINSCYSAIDTQQIGNHAVKQFAAITTDNLSLYAITDDDRVVKMYASTEYSTATIRLGSICEQDPKKELKVTNVRAIFSNITEDCEVTCSLFTNNRFNQSVTTKLKYSAPSTEYSGTIVGIDVGTQTNNIVFSFPNSQQGWKAFATLSWTGGASLISTSVSTADCTPMQPIQTQAVVQQT